jgi:hypothetical protein
VVQRKIAYVTTDEWKASVMVFVFVEKAAIVCYAIFEVFYGVIQNVRECYSIFLLDLFLATCFPTYQTPGWFEDECSPISDS